jgi:hypothetical protein
MATDCGAIDVECERFRKKRQWRQRWCYGLRRPQAERLARADAAALIRDHRAEAYSEARRRERDEILPDGDNPRRPDARALAARRAHRGADDGQASRRRYGEGRWGWERAGPEMTRPAATERTRSAAPLTAARGICGTIRAVVPGRRLS